MNPAGARKQGHGASSGRVGRRAALKGLASIALGACATRAPRSARARVVSLSPSTTEALFAIGAGDLVVGRSRFCDFPPEAEKLPVVGGFADPNLERILGLRPTLVTGARGPAGPALEAELKGHGVVTFFPETESVAQIEAMLEALGGRLGVGGGASRAIAAIESHRARVAAAVAGRTRVRALLLFDANPIVVAGPASFPDELLRLAGGTNVVAAGGAYPTLNFERVLKLAPEVVLDATAEAATPGRLEALRAAPGWREIHARFVALVGSEVLRPGPRIGDGLEIVARALFPDLGSHP